MENFHANHKVIPSGNGGPYARAKHAQVVEKDLEGAVEMFKKAIREGDRVESAVKDMAVVLKQLDRSEEAINVVKSSRFLCSKQSQESLDNLLIDLYKKCGRVDEQIVLLKQKLRSIYKGEAFNGKITKTARSHGKKFQVSITQETSRILGNLGWAYMQKKNYIAAEVVYKKAQMVDPDANKAYNLGLCLFKQTRYDEARSVLQPILQGRFPTPDYVKVRTEELVTEMDAQQRPLVTENVTEHNGEVDGKEDDIFDELERLMSKWVRSRSRRLPIFEEISQFRDQLAC